MTERLLQHRTDPRQLFPSPREGELVDETPPVFVFLQEKGPGDYRVEVADEDGRTVFDRVTQQSFLRPETIFPAGTYRWRVSYGVAASDWVCFTITEQAVPFLRPDAAALLDAVPNVRPRHLFCREDIPGLLHQRAPELAALRRNVAAALAHGMPEPPRFHLETQAVAYHEYFIRHRQFVDRDLVACALAWALLADTQARDHGVRLLLTLCAWDPEGPCAVDGPWGDEIGLSHARCLPAAIDLLWDALDKSQRRLALQTVARYGMQCQRRLAACDFLHNPGDSHAGRLPAYLGEMAFCLQGTGILPRAVLLEWLNLALDVYSGFFPFFGGPDGGWAEGVFYGTSYTKWYLPFFCAAYRFGHVSFLDRPFYQRYPRFLEHFVAPGQEQYPFGDGYWCTAESTEFPGFFAQNPYRVYAQRTGTPLLQRFERQLAAPALFELHLLDVFLPPLPPPVHSLAEPTSRAALFPDAGLLSLHTTPEAPEHDLVLLARGSRYGSASHQHADQGSFCLKYGGVSLISPSGYYGRCYGTAHHRQWTNTSQAHNTLLVDGQGQATWSVQAVAQVLFARDEGNCLTAEIDGTDAYPQVTRWRRRFRLEKMALAVEDEVFLACPLPLTWCLHMLSRPEVHGLDLHLCHRGVSLTVEPLEGLLLPPVCTDRFATPLDEGVPPELTPDMPPQYHVQWHTKPSQTHFIRVRMRVLAPS